MPVIVCLLLADSVPEAVKAIAPLLLNTYDIFLTQQNGNLFVHYEPVIVQQFYKDKQIIIIFFQLRPLLNILNILKSQWV
ncbi:MAG: hypothetical protein R3311_18330, partial [Oceanisphaera sp.]|nr:hypothetical protein [Oceanisphaera sp.]